MADEVRAVGMTAPQGAARQPHAIMRCGPDARPADTHGSTVRPPRWHQSDSLELGAYPGAVPSARLHARAVLEEWQLGDLAEDAGQIVSELIANAVEVHQREHLDAPVRLTLLAGSQDLLIVVCDASDVGAQLAHPSTEDESGRGLLIVDALADQWDTRSFPDGGKAVRALLRVPSRGGRGC